MKPRFSIIDLLSLTAWVGITIAALATLSPSWTYGVLWTWVGVLVWNGANAAQPSAARTVFASGLLYATLIYSAASAATARYGILPGVVQMPHTLLAEAIVGPMPSTEGSLATTEYLDRIITDEYVVIILFANTSLAFGLIGGCLALWRQGKSKPSATESPPTA